VVAVYTDFRLDESYTPSEISVRCGTNFNDLQVSTSRFY
jgi:anaphase-promoting complex subunit 10